MTKPLNSYLDLCTQFYDLTKPKAPPEDYVFYRTFVEEAQGPVLEPMCGTGRFLLPLLKEGFDISGFDASQHMLSSLQDKAKIQRLKPNIWHGFIEDINITKQYRAHSNLKRNTSTE